MWHSTMTTRAAAKFKQKLRGAWRNFPFPYSLPVSFELPVCFVFRASFVTETAPVMVNWCVRGGKVKYLGKYWHFRFKSVKDSFVYQRKRRAHWRWQDRGIVYICNSTVSASLRLLTRIGAPGLLKEKETSSPFRGLTLGSWVEGVNIGVLAQTSLSIYDGFCCIMLVLTWMSRNWRDIEQGWFWVRRTAGRWSQEQEKGKFWLHTHGLHKTQSTSSFSFLKAPLLVQSFRALPKMSVIQKLMFITVSIRAISVLWWTSPRFQMHSSLFPSFSPSTLSEKSLAQPFYTSVHLTESSPSSSVFPTYIYSWPLRVNTPPSPFAVLDPLIFLHPLPVSFSAPLMVHHWQHV
jgi:hypothetical protein